MPENTDNTIPISRVQKLTAERMLESKRTIPCYYLTSIADVSRIYTERRKLSKQLGVRIAMNDFFIKAIALATKKFPLFGADNINIGLAVAAPFGLVVPVIKNADKKTLAQIAVDCLRLVDKARDDRLELDELQNGCTTLTTLGMFGIESFLAIPIPGQTSIISAGRITETVVRQDSEFIARKKITFGISADATKVSAAYAGKFLVEITDLLSNPDTIID